MSNSSQNRKRRVKGILDYKGGYRIEYRVNGRRVRKFIGPSKTEAEAILCKIKTQIREGKYFDIKKQERITFKDFAQTYMQVHSKPNKRSWATGDVNSLKSLVPWFGNRYLYEITPMMVERYKGERMKHVSAASVNRELACLKCMCNKAIEWGKATSNPARQVKLFKEDNGRVRYLEKEEISRLIENCSPRLRAIVTFALNTGARKAEIMGLRWHDVDLERGLVCFELTKNGERRFVPINGPVRDVLTTIRKHPHSPFVFCGKKGNPYNVRKSFETVLKKSGILHFRFHDLRHTFASHLVMGGVDLNTVRELLGHKSLAMTLRYTHLSRDHKTRAVEVLSHKMDTIWTPARKRENEENLTDIVTSLELAS